MLTIIFRGLSATVSILLKYTLGLRLLARIRQRNCLKWGVPAMFIAVPYFLIAATCTQIIENGGSRALYLVVLWCFIVGGAFVLMGPISILLLATARIREAIARHRTSGQQGENAGASERRASTITTVP